MTLDEYIKSIRDKRIAVIGIGVSNQPLIEKLLSCGCHITACDQRSLEQMGEEGEKLLAMGAELRLGPSHLEGLDQDIIFRTPGLMPFDPHLQAAKARGSLLTSEMELFMRLCPCPIIAVTGSDGKTTTSSIIAELLASAGYKVHLGGNIGHPLLCETGDISPDDIAVLELSSFQLHSMSCKPRVAVITNLSPNHLDKHKDFDDYRQSKASIFLEQDKNDKLVLFLEDPNSGYYAAQAKSSVSYFSHKETLRDGAYLKDGVIYRASNGKARAVMDKSEIRLPGEHNVLNYLAAFTAVEGLVDDELCAKVAREFAGVEHRLEQVRQLRGVTYINDSIGTSPTRTIAGLKALKTKPILIAGGYDKHLSFEELGEQICLLTKAVYLSGATAEKIRTAILSAKNYSKHPVPVQIIDDFRETVLAASASAEEGDIVLLSPACAAFDKFKNFMERGKCFKNIIMELE